jgi:hypothetical protein
MSQKRVETAFFSLFDWDFTYSDEDGTERERSVALSGLDSVSVRCRSCGESFRAINGRSELSEGVGCFVVRCRKCGASEEIGCDVFD